MEGRKAEKDRFLHIFPAFLPSKESVLRSVSGNRISTHNSTFLHPSLPTPIPILTVSDAAGAKANSLHGRILGRTPTGCNVFQKTADVPANSALTGELHRAHSRRSLQSIPHQPAITLMNSRPVFFRISRNRRNAASAPRRTATSQSQRKLGKPSALRGSIAAVLTSATSLFLGTEASAATIYWDGAASASWGLAANWSTASGAITPDPGAFPGALDDLIFNISTANIGTLIYLDGNQLAKSLTFNNTGTTTFNGNTSGTTVRTLTITDGITMASGAGTVTIGDAPPPPPRSTSSSTPPRAASPITVPQHCSSTAPWPARAAQRSQTTVRGRIPSG
ncbi:MAG: hypothetical protein NTV08_05290 [Verrucomicrobia bacterium]|nr:hypothetical protein [Verrucomicrobiota bacterium]